MENTPPFMRNKFALWAWQFAIVTRRVRRKEGSHSRLLPFLSAFRFASDKKNISPYFIIIAYLFKVDKDANFVWPLIFINVANPKSESLWT